MKTRLFEDRVDDILDAYEAGAFNRTNCKVLLVEAGMDILDAEAWLKAMEQYDND